MPLIQGTTKASREKNIKTEINAGKDPKQAAAIGYSVQRKNAAKKGHDGRRQGLSDALKKFVDCMGGTKP